MGSLVLVFYNILGRSADFGMTDRRLYFSIIL